jgi:hypothetical protein
MGLEALRYSNAGKGYFAILRLYDPTEAAIE